MSGPQSLREARTKRQKAKVYKTSRNEFRSTLNAENGQPSEQDVTDQGDDKIIKRKIMKVNVKGVEENTEGEGSYDVNMIDADKAPKTEVREEKEGNEEKAETGEGKTQDDEQQDEDGENGNNDQKVEKKKKKDDETDDNGGNNCNPNKNDGELDDECDDDSNDRDDIGGDNGDGGRDNENQNTEGSNEKNAQEQDSEMKEGGADDFEISKEVPKFVDPYDLDFTDDDIDDDSNEEDIHEFLSQDGGDGFESDVSYGGEDAQDDLEELRSAG